MITEIEKKGMIFVGHSTDNKRMEIMELKGMFNSHSKPHMYCTATKTERIMNDIIAYFSTADHPYYVGVQYHPEYLTRPITPSAPYLGLILASSGKLSRFLTRGCQLSPHTSYDYNPDDELDDEVTQAFSRFGNLGLKESEADAVFIEKTD